MIAILWRYAVRPSHAAAFEAVYGPRGDWAQLFARSPGYIGTDLLRDAGGGYLTIDRWTDEAAFAAFKAEYPAAYAALDAECAALTEAEHQLGVFQVAG